MNNKLTISLVTWNGEKYLDECLKSLQRQTFQDFDLVIQDNGSKDNSLRIIKNHLSSFGERARLIVNATNLGFARAHNIGIQNSSAQYVMILNQDITLEDDYLEKCLAFLEKNPQAGVVSGKILQWQVTKEGEGYRYEKTKRIDSLGHKIYKSQRVSELHVGELDDERFVSNIEVFGVSATVPIYRRSSLEAVKYNDEYFDPDFFSYKEDVDLAYRLRWTGFSAWTLASVRAYHDRSAKSTDKMSTAQNIAYRKEKSSLVNYNSYKNQYYLLIKNLSWKNFWRFVIYIKLDLLERFIYVLIFEPKNLKALGEVARNFSKMTKKRAHIMQTRKVSDNEIAKWFQ